MTKQNRDPGDSDSTPISFEAVDATIFRILDTRTKLDALQQYFFPRLERLLNLQLDRVRAVLQVEPLETLTYVYRPSHRQSSRTSLDTSEVYVGLSGQSRGAALKVLNREGRPYKYSVSSLCLSVHKRGAIYVSFRPYLYYVDDSFRERLASELEAVWGDLSTILEWSRIRAGAGAPIWMPLGESLDEDFPKWESPPIHFPASTNDWLRQLQLPFLSCYAVLDTAVRLSRGQPSRLPELVSSMWDRADDDVNHTIPSLSYDPAEPSGSSDELRANAAIQVDDYTLVRPGKRWQVFARDGFACRACGRKAKDSGVILHIDHITPRSLGGTDDLANLQTLCSKCNLGKSNRSTERLT